MAECDMSAIPDIPGYYYDAEKRKYFKIEAHGNPSNPYSRDNIAKRRQAEEQRIRLERETRLQIDQLEDLRPFQRWTHSASTVRGYLNSREIGLSKPFRDRGNLPTKFIRRQKAWHIQHSEDPLLGQLTSFALDEDSGDAILGTYGGLVSAMSTRTSDSINIRLDTEPQTTVTRFTSRVNSISLSPDGNQGKALVCCSLGNEHGSGTIHIGKYNHAVEDGEHGLEVHAVLKPGKRQALFCTTISRYTHDLFAVGGEYAIFVLGGLYEHRPILNIRSNCLAVEFLGEHTLAAGSRNGRVRLYDFRGQVEVQMTNLMIRHPSSVTHMRQINDHLLMIAGLENSLAMYDLRYINKNKSGNRRTTPPLVSYSGHVNSISFPLGFDITPDRSILAAAGDDHFVRLWSVNTGERIHARISENRFDDAVIGLQFSRQNNDHGLWIAGQDIEYWSI